MVGGFGAGDKRASALFLDGGEGSEEGRRGGPCSLSVCVRAAFMEYLIAGIWGTVKEGGLRP